MKNLLEDSYESYSYFLKHKVPVAKANPYKDAQGRFTTKAKAVAPKGKKPKLKVVSKPPRKMLKPIHSTMDDTSGSNDSRFSPSGLVRAGVITEAQLEEHWKDFLHKRSHAIGTTTRTLIDDGDFGAAWNSLLAAEKARFCKSLVSKTVGKELEAKFTPEELSIALYGTSNVQVSATGANVVDQALTDWADSSGIRGSIQLGEAARKLLGADGNLVDNYEIREAKEYNEGLTDKAGIKRKVTEEVVRIIYNNTQKHLQSLDATHVSLQRGVGTETVSYNRGMERHKVSQRPISSWSFDAFTAETFAGEFSRRVVVSSQIPIDRVFSTPLTGIGCLSESEFVILAPKKTQGKLLVRVRREAA